MLRKTNKRKNKGKRKGNGTRKQKPIIMVGCSKKNKKSCKNNISCPKCGPNCHCGPKCNCPHPCPGSCYLNHSLKGGSGCGSCGCPIAPYPMKGGFNSIPPATVPLNYKPILGTGQNGGNCSTCAQIPVQKSGAPIPGPIIGHSWGTSVDKWPGVNGIGSDRNYLKSYDTNNNIVSKDPQLQMSMGDSGYKFWNSIIGGRGRKKHKSNKSKTIKGGGLIPQDLLNLGRDFSFNFKSAYNSLNGYKAPVNPLPYKDQLLNTNKILL